MVLALNTEELLRPFDELLARPVVTLEEALTWLRDYTTVYEALSDLGDDIYVRMSQDVTDKQANTETTWYNQDFTPALEKRLTLFSTKLLSLPCQQELKNIGFALPLRVAQKDVDLYREDLVPLKMKLASLETDYMGIQGTIQVAYDGKTMTIDEANLYLENFNRKVREEAFRAVFAARENVAADLTKLYKKQVTLRNKLATSLGFPSYVDYIFLENERFDYTPEDCFTFHRAVSTSLLPVLERIYQRRKRILGVKKLRPWDLAVNINSAKPIVAYQDLERFLDRVHSILQCIDPEIADCFVRLRENNRLDLEPRANKMSGGFQSSFLSANMPFIFLNMVKSPDDIKDLFHEMGHAYHTHCLSSFDIIDYKLIPTEIAELASTTLELISMDYASILLDDPVEQLGLKLINIENLCHLLEWVVCIDSFQHRVYTHPKKHINFDTLWQQTFDEYGFPVVDWSGIVKARRRQWQKQIHIFEYPFYYIEYGFTYLASLWMWKKYREDPRETMALYKEVLGYGYTESVRDVYNRIGIGMDWSPEKVSSLIAFLQDEYESTIKQLEETKR